MSFFYLGFILVAGRDRLCETAGSARLQESCFSFFCMMTSWVCMFDSRTLQWRKQRVVVGGTRRNGEG